MSDLDFILNWTEGVKKEIERLPFGENDIRRCFFGLFYSIGCEYYRGKTFAEFSKLILNKDILFTKKTSKLEPHVKKAVEIIQYPLIGRSHHNNLNRNLMINSWSTFELCVTTLCESLCSEEEREKMLLHQYTDIKKSIKKYTQDDRVDAVLIKSTKKLHLTHVPIARKTDFLFKKAVNYYRNVQKDREFLAFMGKLRNTLHTNFIYYGNDYEYYFGDANFRFRNGELVKWIDPFEPSPKLYFYLINHLKEIWHVLITAIKYEGLIEYPDLEQE